MGIAAAGAWDYCRKRRKGATGAKGCAAGYFTQRRKGATGAKIIALCIFEKIMGVVVEIWWGWSIFGGLFAAVGRLHFTKDEVGKASKRQRPILRPAAHYGERSGWRFYTNL